MEVKNQSDHDQQKPISVLEGDHGFNLRSKILSRESSLGQSSRIYYRSAEGVPFQWEMLPGTPKNPPQEELFIPPPSPSPLMQSLVLPKPCIASHLQFSKDPPGPKVWFLKKIKKIQQKKMFQMSTTRKCDAGNGIGDGLSRMRNNDDKNGYSDGEFTGSSFNRSCLSSFSSSSSSNGQVLDSSSQLQRDSVDGHFSCSPWTITSILDEDDTKKINPREGRKQKRTAFVNGDNDSSYLKKILSRVSSADQTLISYYRSSEGVPLQWEMQPGKPKNIIPEDKTIPPPSPPPPMQNLFTLPTRSYNGVKRNGSPWTMSRLLIWMRSSSAQMLQKNEKGGGEISFRSLDVSTCDDDEQSGSKSNPSSKGGSWLSKLRRGPLDHGGFCYSFRNVRAQ